MLKISEMSGKLAGLFAINTNTLSNPFCQKQTNGICSVCYSKKMLRTYRSSCVPPFQQNSEILSTCLIYPPPKLNYAYFRLHAHGELINRRHFQNFIHIAEYNPRTMFVLWTKRPRLCYGNRPTNLRLIYSAPQIDIVPSIPKNFDGCFVATHKTGSCKAKCLDCLMCYDSREKIVVTGHIH